MAKKQKEEKARQVLYEAIRGRLEEMRECLKIRYANREADEIQEGVMHGVNKGLHDIQHVLWSFLIDDSPAKETLELNRERLARRVLPIPY